MRKTKTLLWDALPGMFLMCLFVAGVAAQQPLRTETKTPPPAAADDLEKDDILILVNLTAKELKFDAVPDPKVEFPGNKPRLTVWATDRFNIPDKVEPGVTYRNIGITLRISSRFADIERIVREALGEVPVTDAGQPLPVNVPTQAVSAVATAKRKTTTSRRSRSKSP